MDHFVIVDGVRNVLERYSLDNFEREATSKLSLQHPVRTIAAGYASQGPVVLQSTSASRQLYSSDLALFDLHKLNIMPPPKKGELTTLPYDDKQSLHLRASANGKAFTMWAAPSYNQGVTVLSFVDSNLAVKHQEMSSGFVVPSPDGMHIFTEGTAS